MNLFYDVFFFVNSSTLILAEAELKIEGWEFKLEMAVLSGLLNILIEINLHHIVLG